MEKVYEYDEYGFILVLLVLPIPFLGRISIEKNE